MNPFPGKDNKKVMKKKMKRKKTMGKNQWENDKCFIFNHRFFLLRFIDLIISSQTEIQMIGYRLCLIIRVSYFL